MYSLLVIWCSNILDLRLFPHTIRNIPAWLSCIKRLPQQHTLACGIGIYRETLVFVALISTSATNEPYDELQVYFNVNSRSYSLCVHWVSLSNKMLSPNSYELCLSGLATRIKHNIQIMVLIQW